MSKTAAIVGGAAAITAVASAAYLLAENLITPTMFAATYLPLLLG